jgi:hypothetical protein
LRASFHGFIRHECVYRNVFLKKEIRRVEKNAKQHKIIL